MRSVPADTQTPVAGIISRECGEATGLDSALIGYTGFVGSNLTRQFAFDQLFNTRNISSIRGREFGFLVCAGVSAVKWWANQNPAEDRKRIGALLLDLRSVRAREVVVLSTIDVYPVLRNVDESFDCRSLPNHAYGSNRLYFEEEIRGIFPEAKIARLPGLFGPGLKKNVIFDLVHDNCLDAINPNSWFQYYGVSELQADLMRFRESGVHLMNFVSEPIRTADVISRFFPGKRVGKEASCEVHYDVQTRYAGALGAPGAPGSYLRDAERVMESLGRFLAGVRRHDAS